jgi:hemolysin activation/secretion protein
MSVLIVGALLAAAAQPEPTAPAPLILDQGRADRVPPAQPNATSLPVLKRDALSDVAAKGATVAIRGIDFVGAKAPAMVAEAARPFLDKPASRETLDALAQALSKAYAKSPIALYTIGIPDQDFRNGRVKVLIAEGFIEDILYSKGASSQLRALGERLRREKPLTRRSLERYLSLMRDMPGLKLDAKLMRGRKPGGVVLVLSADRKRSDFSIGIDNRGTQGLGDGQYRAEAHGYNLLRDGDRTDLSLLAGLNPKRYQYASLSHATPLNADGLMLSAAFGYLKTRPKDTMITGTAGTASMTVSYPLIRGYKRNLSVSLGLDGLNSDAALFGDLISSDRTRTLRLAAGYSYVASKSVLSGGATVSRGLDILGARGLAGFSDVTFTKVNARANFDRSIGKKAAVRLRVAGQYSPDRLAASERFAVGGQEFARAFNAGILTADSGFAGSLEFAYRPKLTKRLEGTELYSFVDGARLYVRDRPGFPSQDFDLASAGGGVRFAYASKASLEIEGARSIDRPYAGAAPDWRVNVTWRLSFKH